MDQPLLRTNSPAGDYWTLYIIYDQRNGNTQIIPISFLPTGEIDLVRTSTFNLSSAVEILAPTTALIHTLTGNTSLDLLKLLGFLFTSFYWLSLLQFGQLAPFTYDFSSKGPNFTAPRSFTSTNNIFVNSTLFQIYSVYLRNTLVPLLNATIWPGVTLPPFLPLDETNQLHPTPVTIVRTYTCSKRQMKPWLNATISVPTADYAILATAYTILIFILKGFQKPIEECMSAEYGTKS